MRSVKFDGNRAVRLVEMPDPGPGPGEVVVETAISTLCGSEMHSYRGTGTTEGNQGHEAAGTVVAVGEGVDSPRVGQRVGLSAIVGCGQCEFCAKGQYTFCDHRPHYWSWHTERILIAARGCQMLPNDVSWDAGVLLSGDGLGVPFHSARKIADAAVRTIAVFGVGPIGLGSVLLQSYLGRTVIAVDVSPYRLGLARKLGAAEAINAAERDAVAEVRALTGGRGADVCIEAAGRPATLRQCFGAVRKAGTILINGEQGKVELSPSEDFIRRDITMVGSFFYHFSEFPDMLALYRRGLPLESLLTHHVAFAQAQEAYRAFDEGNTGKVALIYG